MQNQGTWSRVTIGIWPQVLAFLSRGWSASHRRPVSLQKLNEEENTQTAMEQMASICQYLGTNPRELEIGILGFSSKKKS